MSKPERQNPRRGAVGSIGEADAEQTNTYRSEGRRTMVTPTLIQLQAQRDRLRRLAQRAGALKSAASRMWAAGHPAAADAFSLVAARIERELAEARHG